MTDDAPKNLGMPLDMARQNLRDDPNTAEIAKSLGVEVEDYIDKVLEYAQHPDKQPELELLDDEVAAELGPDAASVAEVEAWMEKVISGEIDLDDRVKIAEHDGFATGAEGSETSRAEAGVEAPVRRAPQVAEIQRGKRAAAPTGAGSVLEQQLRAQQRNIQLGVDARRAGGRKPKK